MFSMQIMHAFKQICDIWGQGNWNLKMQVRKNNRGLLGQINFPGITKITSFWQVLSLSIMKVDLKGKRPSGKQS
jgi:hypothetical protein